VNYFFIFGLFLFVSCASLAPEGSTPTLAPFVTDGCTMFVDGPFYVQDSWLQCCESHDFAYWMGGASTEREAADVRLENCVAQKGYSFTGSLMYYGVRLGGGPQFSTPFRWGYGWNYLRPYGPLAIKELQQVFRVLTQEQQQRFREILDLHKDNLSK